MAAKKVYLDRIKNKYGYKNEKYSALVARILAVNREKVATRMGLLTQRDINAQLGKVTKRGKQVKLPNLEDILPSKSFNTLKSAQNGKLITDTLRDAMTSDLRDAFEERTNKLNRKITTHDVNRYREAIEKTFNGYVKKHPKYGAVPYNIEAISTTELRSVSNLVRHEYVRKVQEINPGLAVRKQWIHNPRMSKQPRRGHEMAHGTIVDLDKAFKIQRYKKVGKRFYKNGFIMMDRPHAVGAPPEEVINCSCECIYTIRTA